MTGAVVVAAFDVDGTLTTRDCVRPFLIRLGGWRGIVAALARQPVRSVCAAVRRDRDEVKEIVVGGVLRGREVADVERAGIEHAHRVHDRWLRPDMMQRLRWHQRNGHLTVLVSASLGAYLRPLGAMLGVDAVLCTEVVHAGDRLSATLDGGNCRAGEKSRRLSTWIADHRLAGAEVWAYGDSAGDAEMLAMADRPLLVSGIIVRAVPEDATR